MIYLGVDHIMYKTMKKGKQSEDDVLMDGILNGSQKALGKLYQKYHPKVFFRCLTMIKNREEARDLTQDILLKALSHLNNFRGESSFSTWLYAITSNHCIEYLRKNRIRHYVELDVVDNLADSDLDPTDAIEALTKQVFSGLEQIPPAEKELLLLRYEQSLSIRDLQQRLQLSSSAVKMRLMRARKKLGKAIPAQKIPA